MDRKATASPTKAFFVRMITRDISLEDCILDLIDNSVDGAWQIQGARPMSLSDKTKLSKFEIKIELNAVQFRIIDNCGGITLDQAAEYAFTFGRRDSDPHEKYSIGVYGIGMKRAVFKMGTEIKIRSTYPKKGKTESFCVPIDVTTWLSKDEISSWDFDIDTDKPLPTPGVEILVRQLTEETATSFGDPSFVQRLRRTISRDYALHLHRGLVIRVNGVEIDGWAIELRSNRNIVPMRLARRLVVKTKQQGKIRTENVSVEIIAGMAVSPPEANEPNESDVKESRSGWYVVCNGRVVLAADKSAVAGWGTDGWPKWHPQYDGFLGLVIFASENAKLLPLTTTKRSVDSSSAVYRTIMPYMREASKDWISYTNVRKQALDDAKKIESKAKSLSMYEVAKRKSMRLPSLTVKPKRKTAHISYDVLPNRLIALADALGDINMISRDVGLKSFEYAYDDLVGEE